jgi:hypothetical protein
MVDLKVVQLQEGPSLQDIVGQMRMLADRIEAGEFGEVNTLFAVMPRDDDFPLLFGWGVLDGQNDPIIQLELTKHWLLSNLVVRKP